MNDGALQGIVSVHDVMPETFVDCMYLVDRLRTLKVEPITLLVVPGRQWSKTQVVTLKQLQRDGVILAGHGWMHCVDTINTTYHRIHSLILSRHVAEHLSRSSAEIRQLMLNNYNWFSDHGFVPPTLYVPPAWAMGKLTRDELPDLPFSYFETLLAVYDVKQKIEHKLPIVGYEADTKFRSMALRLWNSSNETLAVSQKKPLRIGIHPRDHHHRLRDDIWSQISRCDKFLSYESIG